MFVTSTVYNALLTRYDKLEARYDALLEKYHALRLLHHVPSPTAAERRHDVSAPKSDIDLVYNTQRALAVDAAYEDLIAKGVPPEQAQQEAQTMIDSIFAPIAGEFQ